MRSRVSVAAIRRSASLERYPNRKFTGRRENAFAQAMNATSITVVRSIAGAVTDTDAGSAEDSFFTDLAAFVRSCGVRLQFCTTETRCDWSDGRRLQEPMAMNVGAHLHSYPPPPANLETSKNQDNTVVPMRRARNSYNCMHTHLTLITATFTVYRGSHFHLK